MVNALYDVGGRQGFLEGAIAWLTDDIRVIVIDNADYTVSISTHDFLNDVPGAARVAVSSAMGTKTSTNGVADAADVTLPSVTGDPSESLVIYKHTGTDATARLIAYIDTATGLPVTPNSGDLTIIWAASLPNIFKL